MQLGLVAQRTAFGLPLAATMLANSLRTASKRLVRQLQGWMGAWTAPRARVGAHTPLSGRQRGPLEPGGQGGAPFATWTPIVAPGRGAARPAPPGALHTPAASRCGGAQLLSKLRSLPFACRPPPAPVC